MAVNTYSANSISVIVGGVPMHGFSEDSVVMVEYTADAFTKKTGADGEVGRAHNPDRSGTITIKLMQTSDSNDYLSGLAITDQVTLSGIVPVLVKDNNGSTIASAEDAWVKKIPNVEFNKDITNRDWVLECAVLNMFAGGNN